MRSGRPNWLTAFLWLLVGAGLGGFFGLEALSYGSVLFVVPVIIVVALLLRARRHHLPRMWVDLGAFLLGAGALALVYAVPAAVAPMCTGAVSGGCSSNGGCWSTGPTDCTINYYGIAITALYAGCLLTGAILVARVRRQPPTQRAVAGRPSS